MVVVVVVVHEGVHIFNIVGAVSKIVLVGADFNEVLVEIIPRLVVPLNSCHYHTF